MYLYGPVVCNLSLVWKPDRCMETGETGLDQPLLFSSHKHSLSPPYSSWKVTITSCSALYVATRLSSLAVQRVSDTDRSPVSSFNNLVGRQVMFIHLLSFWGTLHFFVKTSCTGCNVSDAFARTRLSL